MTGTGIFQQSLSGRPGQRSAPALSDIVETILLDPTHPPTAYGSPVTNTSGKATAIQTNGTGASVIGLLTFPTVDALPSVLNQALGTTTPNPAIAHGLLRNGKAFVTCLGTTAPAAEGAVYVRVRDNGSTGRAVGTIEAAPGTEVGTAAAAAGNTGTGAVTIATPSVVTGSQYGAYKLVCIEPATDAGQFAVYDPQGVFVGKATVAVAFSNQIAFTIADATDFVAGDSFTVTVVADCEAIPGMTFTGPRDSANVVEVRVK